MFLTVILFVYPRGLLVCQIFLESMHSAENEAREEQAKKRPKRKKPLRQAGKSTKHGKSNKPKKSSENEINFNSEEYHKKQHSF